MFYVVVFIVKQKNLSGFRKKGSLQLGSHDVLIVIYCIESHQVKLDFYGKTFDCVDEEGNPRIIK
jgi:hypothetical protein